MKRFAAALALPLCLPLFLSGCFGAEQDLIGSHELRLTRMDSLVSLNGYPGRIDAGPGGAVFCEMLVKQGDRPPCHETYGLKFERTARGNLIVQATGIDVKFLSEGHSVFLLVVRHKDEEEACSWLLGEIQAPNGSPAARAEKAIIDRHTDMDLDRAGLLAVVDEYERTVLPLAKGCPQGQVVIASPTDLAFADEVQP